MSVYYNFGCESCKQLGGFYSRQAWGTGNADLIETFKFCMHHALSCGTENIRMFDEYNEPEWTDTSIDPEARASFLKDTHDIMPRSSDWDFIRRHGEDWAKAKELWVKNELSALNKEN